MSSRVNTNNPSNPLQFEVRKIQQQRHGRSLMVTLPTTYIKKMSLKRGDILKMFLGYGNRSLIMQKVDLSDVSDNSTPIPLEGTQ